MRHSNGTARSPPSPAHAVTIQAYTEDHLVE
jgi:hypothetical protein